MPLWKLVPTHDEAGERLCDFMVLIPRLKFRPASHIGKVQAGLAGLLDRHEEVVFANLDLKLNLLWVSYRYRAGLMFELVHGIRLLAPEAMLVAHNTQG